MPTGCSITAISWERVHLTLLVTLAVPQDRENDVEFIIVDEEREYPVTTTRVGAGEYELSINVTNFHSRKQVPDGTWRFIPKIAGKPAPAARWDLNRLDQLDQDSRTFIYAGNRVAYMVRFGIGEDEESPDLLMRTYQMFRNPKSLKVRTLSPVVWVKRRLFTRTRRVQLVDLAYRVSRRVRPPNGKRILFASEMRPSMEGNLLRIHDRMVERGLDTRFEMRYSFRTPHVHSKKTSLRLIYLIASSDIVLIDDYFAILQSMQISPETKIIQAWHAGSGFKSIGYSRFGNYGSPKLQNAHRKYTYAITGSKHLVPVYAEAFGIEESAIISTGLPRIDTFLDPDRQKKVVDDFFAQYPDLKGKRIILFAPTFRGRGTTTAYYDYSVIDFAKLHEVCGDDTVVLFRMHHYVIDEVPIPPEYTDRLLNFRSFPDTNDLLLVTDVLITDYSSIIYEFVLLDRPMLFFAYDKDVYAATRGFHRDYEETAPGKVCESFDELVKAIQDKDYDTWKIEGFRRENFDVVDTSSADRVIDWLILGDPKSSYLSTSDPALSDPVSGDAVVGDANIGSDQDEV